MVDCRGSRQRLHGSTRSRWTMRWAWRMQWTAAYGKWASECRRSFKCGHTAGLHSPSTTTSSRATTWCSSWWPTPGSASLTSTTMEARSFLIPHTTPGDLNLACMFLSVESGKLKPVTIISVSIWAFHVHYITQKTSCGAWSQSYSANKFVSSRELFLPLFLPNNQREVTNVERRAAKNAAFRYSRSLGNPNSMTMLTPSHVYNNFDGMVRLSSDSELSSCNCAYQ